MQYQIRQLEEEQEELTVMLAHLNNILRLLWSYSVLWPESRLLPRYARGRGVLLRNAVIPLLDFGIDCNTRIRQGGAGLIG